MNKNLNDCIFIKKQNGKKKMLLLNYKNDCSEGHVIFLPIAVSGRI